MSLISITCLLGITCCIPEVTTGILTCCIPVEALTVGSRICWIVDTGDDDWLTIDGNLITWFVPLLVDTSVPCLKTPPWKYE